MGHHAPMQTGADPVDTPFDEARRLAALHSLHLIDAGPQREFNALVALAAEMLGCPTALLTLVDRDRQWIKAAIGSDLTETARDESFCQRTIRTDRTTVVADAKQDAQFRTLSLVREGGFRFYAGQPLHVMDANGRRQPVGALCVLDTSPRELPEPGRQALEHLGSVAEALIAARKLALDALAVAERSEQLAADLARRDRVLRQAERIAGIGSWRLQLDDNGLIFSEGLARVYDLPPGQEPSLSGALDCYAPDARARITAALAATAETGAPYAMEEEMVTVAGRHRRVRAFAELERDDENRPTAIVGVLQDVTDQHALEKALRRSAETDALTGIANRAAFDRQLSDAIGRAHADRHPLALALVDLDGFKAINDTFGHRSGDDVLRRVGATLQEPWLRGSFAGRLGGDEFGLIVEDPALTAAPDALRERLETALRWPVTFRGISLASAGTVGVALLDPGCRSVRDFTHRVDTLLYARKRERVGERRAQPRYRVA